MATIDEDQIREDVYHFISAEQKGDLPKTKAAIAQAAYKEAIDFKNFTEQGGDENVEDDVTDEQFEEYQQVWIRVYKQVTGTSVKEVDAMIKATHDALGDDIYRIGE